MKLHEYQARLLLAEYGISVSRAETIRSADEAPRAFMAVANPKAVAKVQVLMGGRGKAGGVQIVDTADQARAFADKFLGKPFSTYQSPEPKTVKAVLLAEDITIEKAVQLLEERAEKTPTKRRTKKAA
jgi:succinyl-CoA synthetase beta subunit